jgi:hypothetical protein
VIANVPSLVGKNRLVSYRFLNPSWNPERRLFFRGRTEGHF